MNFFFEDDCYVWLVGAYSVAVCRGFFLFLHRDGEQRCLVLDFIPVDCVSLLSRLFSCELGFFLCSVLIEEIFVKHVLLFEETGRWRCSS